MRVHFAEGGEDEGVAGGAGLGGFALHAAVEMRGLVLWTCGDGKDGEGCGGFEGE